MESALLCCRWDMQVLGGSPLLVAALLEARANPNDRLKRVEGQLLPSISGMTVLQACVYLHHNEAMKVLLVFKADADATDTNGAASMHWAASSNNSEAVRILMEAGCSPMRPVRTGHVPLEIAAATNSFDVLRELIPIAPREVIAKSLPAVFFFGGGSADAVSMLIEAQADVNLQMSVPKRSLFGLILSFFSIRHRWSKSTLSAFAYHHCGATPLMLSLITSSFEAAAVLLAAGVREDVETWGSDSNVGQRRWCNAFMMRQKGSKKLKSGYVSATGFCWQRTPSNRFPKKSPALQ
ncbi:MIB2 [Symbiodinium pilosum]|uniref:MIB2 protein n=1 Tax=Symbiodinium pilosum TaxID=2952 RepID=A0A812S0D4_SYMPI|nr:MIB2 [Symbiodinium pilosum]